MVITNNSNNTGSGKCQYYKWNEMSEHEPELNEDTFIQEFICT